MRKVRSRLAEQLRGCIAPDIEKLPLPRGVDPGRELLSCRLAASRRPLMEISMRHDLMTGPRHFGEPAAEVRVFEKVSTTVMIWDDEQRARFDAEFSQVIKD